MTRVATDTPHAEESVIGGVPTTVVRPGGGRRWPVLVFLNGVTARGRRHPNVQRLACGLARAGFLVLVPDPPGLARGEITVEKVAATTRVVRRSDARGGRVGLIGVSVGASLCSLPLRTRAWQTRVTVVAGIAPYTDLANAVRLATTGSTLEEGRLVPYAARSFLALVLARSLVVALSPSRDRAALLTKLRQLPDDAYDPLSVFRRLRPAKVDPTARALVELLAKH